MSDKNQLRHQIKDIVSILYLWTTDKKKNLLESISIRDISENDLKKIISFLEKVKEQQEKFIKKINKKNPDFNKDLKNIIQSEYKKISEKITEQEKIQAEKIFQD